MRTSSKDQKEEEEEEGEEEEEEQQEQEAWGTRGGAHVVERRLTSQMGTTQDAARARSTGWSSTRPVRESSCIFVSIRSPGARFILVVKVSTWGPHREAHARTLPGWHLNATRAAHSVSWVPGLVQDAPQVNINHSSSIPNIYTSFQSFCGLVHSSASERNTEKKVAINGTQWQEFRRARRKL